jgi:hypothetical protein
MMVRRILLEPVGDAWTVREVGQGDVKTFATGAQAESAARAMGERFAQEGAFAHVKVMLRNGKVGGRYFYVPRGDGPTRGAGQGLLTVAA